MMHSWHSVAFALGRPFAPVYGLLMTLRQTLYRRGVLRVNRLPVPVFSIGNLTLGGTGKTPMVMYCARLLQSMGLRPAVVSRGYGGRAKGPVNVVADGQSILLSPYLAGDEPRLLAESLPGVPVLTGHRRYDVGRHAVQAGMADLVLLDDGFQHMGLARDFNLVLFNARTLLGNGRVFPGGPLREPLAALQRADAFVIVGQEPSLGDRVADFRAMLSRRFPAIPQFSGIYRPMALLTDSHTVLPLSDRPEQFLYAFSGLANPASFQHTLTQTDFRIAGFTWFKDHHPYSAADLQALGEAARAAGAGALITTEKDMVKLVALTEAAGMPVLALRIELVMDKMFDDFVIERFAKANG